MTDNNELKILALLQEMKVDSDKKFDKIDKQIGELTPILKSIQKYVYNTGL